MWRKLSLAGVIVSLVVLVVVASAILRRLGRESTTGVFDGAAVHAPTIGRGLINPQVAVRLDQFIAEDNLDAVRQLYLEAVVRGAPADIAWIANEVHNHVATDEMRLLALRSTATAIAMKDQPVTRSEQWRRLCTMCNVRDILAGSATVALPVRYRSHLHEIWSAFGGEDERTALLNDSGKEASLSRSAALGAIAIGGVGAEQAIIDALESGQRELREAAIYQLEYPNAFIRIEFVHRLATIARQTKDPSIAVAAINALKGIRFVDIEGVLSELRDTTRDEQMRSEAREAYDSWRIRNGHVLAPTAVFGDQYVERLGQFDRVRELLTQVFGEDEEVPLEGEALRTWWKSARPRMSNRHFTLRVLTVTFQNAEFASIPINWAILEDSAYVSDADFQALFKAMLRSDNKYLRICGARNLAAAGDLSGVTVLLELLDTYGNGAVDWNVYGFLLQTLRDVTGQNFLDDVDAWQSWATKAGLRTD